jgi:hypothetical protein
MLTLLRFPTLALLALTGCSSAPSGSGGSGRDANPFEQLVLGMTAEQVRALVGAPQAVRPDPAGGVGDEFWHYRHKRDEVVRQVSIGTRDVPAVNPITGQDIIIKEPIMGNEYTTLYLDFELLIIDGRLRSIDLRRHHERNTTN